MACCPCAGTHLQPVRRKPDYHIKRSRTNNNNSRSGSLRPSPRCSSSRTHSGGEEEEGNRGTTRPRQSNPQVQPVTTPWPLCVQPWFLCTSASASTTPIPICRQVVALLPTASTTLSSSASYALAFSFIRSSCAHQFFLT
ncbi:hypothetical protein E2C01_054006 [Portunus trituberculatus]|uniref:Uncharacterized protein n=1 Tax=Portunus trituberculatus TaxID=210409 RepID=A0A5B7GQT3_PORTR|nr:hypothetical protein [Portunus trituberculatus]